MYIYTESTLNPASVQLSCTMVIDSKDDENKKNTDLHKFKWNILHTHIFGRGRGIYLQKDYKDPLHFFPGIVF